MKKPCSVKECDNEHWARGWCRNHYRRWKNHGNPEGGSNRYASPEESFKARTVPAGDCLVWIGGKNRKGYGLMSVAGKPTAAHRYAWVRERGAVPEGKIIDHICHNPSCVKIDHLRLATYQENGANRAGAQSANKLGLRNISRQGAGYRVQIGHRGDMVYRAYFGSLEEAIKVAAQKRTEIYGAYAGRG